MKINILFAILFIGIMVMNVWSNTTSGSITFGSLKNVLCNVEDAIEQLLGPIAFLLVIMAAVIYAGGQLGDAQLRAKAQGWAVGALVGAIIAFVLSTVGPTIIKQMFTGGTCP